MTMQDIMERPEKLEGCTYRIRWVGLVGDVSYFITINHMEVNGRLIPFELFITSRDVTHAPWMVALARTISAVLRCGGDIGFLAGELQEIYDPIGPQIVGNESVRSLIALIGKALEEHMISIGYLGSKE